MPTWCRPDFAAFVAVSRAAARPFVLGYETSTIVQPFSLAGQTARPFGRPGFGCPFVVGSGAVGSVPVFPTVGAVAVGTGVGSVSGTVAWVSTNVSPAAAELFCVSAIAAAAPAAATSSVSSETQTQSPGYQPSRRIQRLRSEGRR